MDHPFKNLSLTRLLLLVWAVQSSFSLFGYGQGPSEENLQLRLEAGTSAPCPAPESFSISRPDPPGTPTRVGVGMVFLQLLKINDVEESFEADVFYIRYWRDQRLADPARGESHALCSPPAHDFWTPELDFRNVREATEKGNPSALIDAEGNVMLIGRRYLVFSNPMDLSEFPFDRQKLQINVESIFANVGEVQLYPLKNYLQKVGELPVNGWVLDEPNAKVSTEHGRLRGMDYSTMEISLPATRETGFFLLKLIIPLALIVCMSWTIFWVSPTQVAPQLGLGATSMLTLIAYQFALASMLPRISYLTRADEFILWSLILVFLALVEAGATVVLVNRGAQEVAVRMDHICRLVFPLVYIIGIVTTLLI